MISKLVRRTILALALAAAAPAHAQSSAPALSLTVQTELAGPVINRDIFGQFAEHLGTGIYGGVWVGPRSPIANVRGIRSDVVAALRALRVPVVRWPGGCFAEEYHWRDGVGPANRRVTRLNTSWGNVLEPNTFGTHEFFDFIEQIGSEASLTVNVASGTLQEAADWLEYITADQATTLARERAANGRPTPWRVKHLGIGNESWACGGAMTVDTYVERMKLYAMFAHNLNPEQSSGNRFVRSPNAMQRIAVGPMGDDANTDWTEAMMQAWQRRDRYRWSIEGLQFHRYTGGPLGVMRDPATGFSEQAYATFVQNTYGMDRLISVHSAVMDRYDPDKQVMLSVDEFGVWLAPTAGTNPLFLQQQNSLRDGILASLNLNIFARHADRVRMAAVAQMVNVLQSMILTDNERMLLTPTYYVYRMYVPFQDAHFLPIDLDRGAYRSGDIELPQVDAIAARATDGAIWLAVTNIDPNRPAEITTRLTNVAVRSAVGEVLSAAQVDSVNTFDDANVVAPRGFTADASGGALVLRLPPKSVTVVRLTP